MASFVSLLSLSLPPFFYRGRGQRETENPKQYPC